MPDPTRTDELRLIADVALERGAADIDLAARALRQGGAVDDPEAGSPPWFGAEEVLRDLREEGLIEVVVDDVVWHPDDEVFPPQKVRVAVTDAGRAALDDAG